MSRRKITYRAQTFWYTKYFRKLSLLFDCVLEFTQHCEYPGVIIKRSLYHFFNFAEIPNHEI